MTEVIVAHVVRLMLKLVAIETVCPGVIDDLHCPTEPCMDTTKNSY